ncbi:hypothetical protein GALMADRAFT_222813 [Galerina marginata CBS 339.88]|uniref:F-box domain-containing protein n=1 Tax=Galerina marginata (strain CBS 339.88) TaxID=685588 RepID=A0A067T9R1_GALM3|nr:hypothetical protein GALMADRAFT_222813 [Galerina marginata CBS 339.88]
MVYDKETAEKQHFHWGLVKVLFLHSPAVFTALSADVLINVIKFLRPCDIISVRQTCKTLLLITKLRTVWMNALRKVMLDRLITEDTYPLSTMSLHMLEHAALSPHRFISLMKRSDEHRLEPTSIRVLSPRLTNNEKAIHGISSSGSLGDMFLAPGGRYLATLAHCVDNISSLLTIWDLGLSGHDGIKAIARLVQPMVYISMVNFYPDLKKRGIFHLVLRRNTISAQGIHVMVDVHTVTVSPSLSEFTSVAEAKIPSVRPADIDDVFVYPDLNRLIIRTDDHSHNNFLLWDFIGDMTASWIALDCPVTPDLKFFCYDDSLMVALKDKVLIYNIPPLIFDKSELVPTYFRPSMSLSSLIPDFNSCYISQYSWPISHVPQYICAVDTDEVVVHEIKNNRNVHDTTIPNKLPIFAGSAQVLNDDSHFEEDIYDKFVLDQSDGHVFIGCVNSEAADFAIFTFEVVNSPRREHNFKLTKTYMCHDSTLGIDCQQFCPSMGRVCLLTDEKHELHVLDYLVPPDRE